MTETTQPHSVNGVTRRRARAAVINGIDVDTTTAERVYTAIAGANCFTGDGFHRFDTELYRNTAGHFFLVRPLAPDEAAARLEDERHDDVARQLFPTTKRAQLIDAAALGITLGAVSYARMVGISALDYGRTLWTTVITTWSRPLPHRRLLSRSTAVHP